jgi:glycosyltransferase involved in cell wall biosynthesis
MELGMVKVIAGLNGGRMRHSVAYLKGEPEIADRLPRVTRVYALNSRSNDVRVPGRIARLIREVRPTVIHARNWGAWPDAVAGRLLAANRTPLILSFHGLGRAGYMPMRRRAASWVMARMSTRLVAVSNESKELMASKWGWPRGRIEVIPNGVDTERFSPGERGERQGRLTIGTVGNLRPVKNHALLMRACAELVRSGMDLELRIAGEGDERGNLVALASTIGLGDRLKLCGRVEDVPGFLRQLDLFVLSSDSEQHPNALNEAMACGLACVATNVGCVSELLDEGRCGRIVLPGDADAMVSAMRELLQDPTLRQMLGQTARQRACDHYSLSAMLDAYEQLYRECSGELAGVQ